MSISNLPKDLQEEIVSRVPFKSMRAVRLTCKTWDSFLKSRSFTTKHIAKVTRAIEEESCTILMKDYNLHLMSVLFNNEDPSTEAIGRLTCLDNNKEQVKISQVFHCDGLLLCILKDDNTRLVVWNPYLGQTRWIKTTHFGGRDRFKYGIGYEEKDKSTRRSYKILRFMDDNINYVNIERHGMWYEIYDFDSNAWTTYHVSLPWNIAFCDCGVSLKGNMYWCATNEQESISFTICFDFTRMRFGGVQQLPFWTWDSKLVTLTCVGDEKLAVLGQARTTYEIDIWITDKIEEHKVLWGKCLQVKDVGSMVSWNEFLRIDLGLFTDLRTSVARFLVEEEKNVAVVFNKDIDERLDTAKIFGEEGFFSELVLGKSSDRKCWPLVCSYVPSLVQIKLPERGKRKHIERYIKQIKQKEKI